MKNKAGLTFDGAGVEIDVGNAMLEKIKPLAHATRRPDADAEFGGCGGIFGLKAVAHITCGGFGDKLPRVLPKNLEVEIDLSAILVPEVFAWLAANGGVAGAEMLRTFNCGIGMIVIVDSSNAAEVLPSFRLAEEDAAAIGRVVAIAAGERVIYSGRLAL